MGKPILIAVLGGGASALLSMALITGSTLAFMLAYLAALPLFLVGLAHGRTAGGLAGAVGALGAALMGGPLAGAIHAALTALPATLAAVWMAQGAGRGVLVARLALYGAVGLMAVDLGVGAATEGGFEVALSDHLARVMEHLMPGAKAAQRAEFARAVTPFFPGATTASWLVMVAVNAILAQVILSRLGRRWATQADEAPPATGDGGETLATFALPEASSWALVAAAALAVGAKVIGWPEGAYLGRNLVVLLAVPFVFLGLGVVHALAGRLKARVLVLWAFYLVLVLSGWAVLLVAGLGLVEQWMGLRRRAGASPTTPEDETWK